MCNLSNQMGILWNLFYVLNIFHPLICEQEKSEFLLPYLVELVTVLVQCTLSIMKFILLSPYDEESYESKDGYDLFYDRPKHLTREEKRYILAIFIIFSMGKKITSFLSL